MKNTGKSIYWVIAALLFVLLAACSRSDCAAAPTRDEGLEIFYYYNNPCESCDEFNRYASFLGSLLRGDAEKFHIDIFGVNGFHDKNSSFTKICDTIGFGVVPRA